MSFASILLLAVGLAMDAAAVSAARGLAARELRLRHGLIVAAYFGGFQALMPLIGWALGAQIGPFVSAWDHWIAFGLLAFIGGKMIKEAFGSEETPDDEGEDLFGVKVMFVLAVATSIDALAVGLTLPMLGAPLVLSVVTIGVVTGLLSATFLVVGRRFGAMIGPRLDAIGGVVLIGIGAKILFEHTRTVG